LTIILSRHLGIPDRSLACARQCASDITEVATRQKEIQYSSRTRGGMDSFKKLFSGCAEPQLIYWSSFPNIFRNGPRRALVRKAAESRLSILSYCRLRLFARRHIDEAQYGQG
jgi:hypothetical protein